jgi:hypothetical protein
MMTSEYQDAGQVAPPHGSVAAALRSAFAIGLAAAGQIEEALDAAELPDDNDRSWCRQAGVDRCGQVRGNERKISRRRASKQS